MRKVKFKDLLYPTVKGVKSDSEIKNLSLKQVSRGRFEVYDEEIIVKVKYSDEIVEVIFTNEVTVREFRDAVYIAYNKEPSLYFLHERTSMNHSSLLEMLMEYKTSNYVLGSNFCNETWFKLYSEVEIENNLRKAYQAGWIDYEKQLKNSDIIYDEVGLCGLWAMPKSMLLRCLNTECIERYGNKLLVLKPVADCCYLDDEKEIIGDRFKVIDKIDFANIMDLGRLIQLLQQMDNIIAEKEKEELVEKLHILSLEKTSCIDEIIAKRKEISMMKSKCWLALLLGILLGLLF